METYSLREERGVSLAVKSVNGFKLKSANDPNYAVEYDCKSMDVGVLGIVGMPNSEMGGGSHICDKV